MQKQDAVSDPPQPLRLALLPQASPGSASTSAVLTPVGPNSYHFSAEAVMRISFTFSKAAFDTGPKVGRQLYCIPAF